MEGADVSNANFEMACMKDANLKNAVVNGVLLLAPPRNGRRAAAAGACVRVEVGASKHSEREAAGSLGVAM
jgi:hypothetical protein